MAYNSRISRPTLPADFQTPDHVADTIWDIFSNMLNNASHPCYCRMYTNNHVDRRVVRFRSVDGFADVPNNLDVLMDDDGNITYEFSNHSIPVTSIDSTWVNMLADRRIYVESWIRGDHVSFVFTTSVEAVNDAARKHVEMMLDEDDVD